MHKSIYLFTLILLIISMGACTLNPSNTNSPMGACENENTGIVLFAFGEGFDYRHYEGTRATLEKAGYCALITSNSLEPIKGQYVGHGFESNPGNVSSVPDAQADLLLKDVQVADYKAIVFISDNSIVYEDTPELLQMIREAHEQGIVLAAQEFAVPILGSAGVLEGVEVSGNPLICQQMETEYNAICTYMPVAKDDGIITADPSFASVRFARSIIEAVQER